VEKLNTIWSTPRKFSINEIKNIGAASKSRKTKWSDVWGLSGGKIEIDYFGQKRYFGQSISPEEAHSIINEVQKLMNEQNPN